MNRRIIAAIWAIAVAAWLAAFLVPVSEALATPARHHHHCVSRASDSDHEYAGDHDVFCPGPSPSPSPSPSPTPTPTPPPPTPTPGSLDAFFGPSFTGPSFCHFSHQVASVSGGVLTVRYPAGSSAPSAGAPFGGAQDCLPFASGPRKSATLAYDVRFPAGFQWVKGGKLPGLYGGVEPFSGGSHNANGWSARLMWRAGGAGEVYAYIATSTGFGDDFGRGNFAWPADGQWHHVAEVVNVNTPGRSDGSMILSVDGRLVVNQTSLDITNTGTPVTGLFFSTFYGGHDSSWSPTSGQHIDFRNFAEG